MTLTQDLRARTLAFISGEISPDGVRVWLIEHAQVIVEEGDPELEALDGEWWALLSELDRGDRDAASMRIDLATLVEYPSSGGTSERATVISTAHDRHTETLSGGVRRLVTARPGSHPAYVLPRSDGTLPANSVDGWHVTFIEESRAPEQYV